jgi:hypothetical protein
LEAVDDLQRMKEREPLLSFSERRERDLFELRRREHPVLVQESTDRTITLGDASCEFVESIAPTVPVTSTPFMADSDPMSGAAFAATNGTAVQFRIHASIPLMSACSDDPLGGAATCMFSSLHRVVCMNDP